MQGAVVVEPEPAEQPVSGGYGEQRQGAQTVEGAVAVGGGARFDTGGEGAQAHRRSPSVSEAPVYVPSAIAAKAWRDSVPGAK